MHNKNTKTAATFVILYYTHYQDHKLRQRNTPTRLFEVMRLNKDNVMFSTYKVQLS